MSSATVEQRLAILEAKEQLRSILDVFTLCLDSLTADNSQANFDAFADLHTTDCEFVHPISVVIGGKAIAQVAVDHLKQFSSTLHCFFNFIFVTLDLPNGVAKLKVNAIYTHIFVPRLQILDPTDRLREYTQTGGKYDFEFRVVDGLWKISKNNFVPFFYNGTGPCL